MKWYAEIDESGKCFHVTQNELPLSETIVLADRNVLGERYENGVWVKVEPEPVEPEPSQLDRIEAKIQVNEDLQAFYDEIVEEVGL